MREIKVRGKSVETGEWVHGYLIGPDAIVGEIVDWDSDYFATEFWQKVDPKTIGQKTGAKNHSGQEIYEGDIIDFVDLSERRSRLLVEWSEVDACFVYGWVRMTYAMRGTVLGNIHDNPELLQA